MTVEIKSFIRPTQIVRSVMRAHGKNPYMIFTNSYKHCRTVKCYVHNDQSLQNLIDAIRRALEGAGVDELGFRVRPAPFWRAGVGSLIVRIPRTEQA